MIGKIRTFTRGALLTTTALLALAVAEACAQGFAGGQIPGYGYGSGYNTGVMGTTGIAGGYSSYGSRSFSGFGLGGFQRGYGASYSSGYVGPGVAVYPVPAGYGGFGGYPGVGGNFTGLGGGYPGFFGGYPGVGYPVFTPTPGNIVAPTPLPGNGATNPNRPGGFDRVQGGTHVPGFGVMGGSFR